MGRSQREQQTASKKERITMIDSNLRKEKQLNQNVMSVLPFCNLVLRRQSPSRRQKNT